MQEAIITKRFVTITDLHVRTKTPRSRTETDWLEVGMLQLERALALADKIGARALLMSGDIGDNAEWTFRMLGRMHEVLSQYAHIPVITTVGQHDVKGHDISSWPKWGLGTYAKVSGLVQVLVAGESVVLDKRVEVFGFGFGEPETEELLTGKFPVPRDSTTFKIALVHAQVGPGDSMGWHAVENQKITGFDVASFGDIHCGFEPYELPSGTVAYSTGSLLRTSLTDLGRVPYAGIITVQDDNSYEIDFEPLPDGDDATCFWHEDVESIEGDTAEIFKEMLRAARDHRDESPKERVRRVAQNGGFTERHVSLVVDRIEVG